MNEKVTLEQPIIKDSFLGSAVLVLASSMGANVFNYVFQVVTGRLLSVEAYGEMNALFSLLALFSFIITPVSGFLINETAGILAKGRLGEVSGLYRYTFGRFFLVLISGAALLAIASPFISEFIRTGWAKVVLVAFLGMLSIVSGLNVGFVQGLQFFGAFSAITIAGGISKVLLGAGAAWLALGTTGVLAGVGLTTILTGGMAFVVLRFRLAGSAPAAYQPEKARIRWYLIPMGVINLLFVALTQGDLVLVKHFFSQHDVGIYASAGMLGKAVMYLPGALVPSLFPIVSARSAGRQATRHILVKALGLNALLSGGGALALGLFPDFIVGTFFGERYLPAAQVTPLFGLAMFPMGVINLLMSYSLARGRIRSILPLSAAFGVEVCGILLFHDSLQHVLLSILFAGCTGILVFAVFLVSDRHGKSCAKR